MQCPNCRRIEKGQWLYANGSTRSLPDLSMEDWIPDEDFYDLSYSEMVNTIQRIICSSPLVLCSLFKTCIILLLHSVQADPNSEVFLFTDICAADLSH